MGSKYERYTAQQMNDRLPIESNWKYIRRDGYEKRADGRRRLMTVVKCKCGKLERHVWNRIVCNEVESCGCLTIRSIKVGKNKKGEIWTDVAGYESAYQVSNMGRVRSKFRWIKCAIKGKECQMSKPSIFLRAQKCINGYVRVTLRSDMGLYKIFPVHRLVANAFVPNPENKPFVNHINGIKDDNSFDNLEWVTAEENMQHAYKTGLQKALRGSKNSCTKIKVKQFNEIKQKHKKGGLTYDDLANAYNVSRSTIWRIIQNKRYK